MNILIFLIPVTIVMGIIGLVTFFWTLRDGQYEDLNGDAQRILFDEDSPLPGDTAKQANKEQTP